MCVLAFRCSNILHIFYSITHVRKSLRDVQPPFRWGQIQRLLPIPEILLGGRPRHPPKIVERVQQGNAQETQTLRDTLHHQEPAQLLWNIHTRYIRWHSEIKDSCDFVEISEFGYCIGKTFLQLLKIIKWFLKSWLSSTFFTQRTLESSRKPRKIRSPRPIRRPISRNKTSALSANSS